MVHRCEDGYECFGSGPGADWVCHYFCEQMNYVSTKPGKAILVPKMGGFPSAERVNVCYEMFSGRLAGWESKTMLNF